MTNFYFFVVGKTIDKKLSFVIHELLKENFLRKGNFREFFPVNLTCKDKWTVED